MVSLWVHICIINKWRDKAVTEPFLRSEILWYVQNFQWFQNFIFPVEIILTNSYEFLKFDEYCRSWVTCRVHFVPKAVWLLILFKECLSIFKKSVAPSDSWSAVLKYLDAIMATVTKIVMTSRNDALNIIQKIIKYWSKSIKRH